MKITILGCGASAGVPLVGCDCAVCTSDNPKNKRTRPSIMVESQSTRLLIDTAPDLRQQLMRSKIKTVDAILYTHAHADHVHGIDDIRSLNYHAHAPIQAYGDAATMNELQERFAYVFRPPIPEYGWFRPCLEANEIEAYTPFTIGDLEVIPFLQDHGRSKSLGYRIGNFAYTTDVKSFPKESQPYLYDLDLWIVDCLTDERPMPTHADLSLSLEWIEKYKPGHAILTHMSHALEYEELSSRLPEGVSAAYDGRVVEVSA